MAIRTNREWGRLLFVLCAALSGCQAESRLAPNTQPALPPADIAPYAFYLDIDVEHGVVRVVPPTVPSTAAHQDGMAFSLAGAELVGLTTSNFFRSNIGQFVPYKRTITFDLALTNKLSVTDLVTPTFPLPPTGAQGILAFPYTVAAFGVQGGKATPNTDWNGNGSAGSGGPLNFFNDFGTCGTAVTSDCYRWEMFPTPLLPGHSTAGQKVGFTVDKNVTSVGVYLVVAADLLDHPPPPPQPGLGALLGVASSPQLGFLSGATVTLTPGGQTAVTDGVGKFLFSGLPVGAFTATLSGLPASCGSPASVSGAITSGGVATADFVVSCVPTTGSLAGQIERVDNGLNGVVLVPMPGIGISLGGRSAITDPNGSFSLTGLAPGNYVIDASVLTGLGNCQTYGGPTTVTVVAGQTGPATVTVICFATLQGQITSSQGPVSQVVVQYQNNYGFVSLATSNAAGQYQAYLPTGDYGGVAVQLPSGCTQLSPAAPQQLTFAMGQVITLDFVLDCGAYQNGFVRDYFSGLPLPSVSLTADGLQPPPSTVSSGTGGYQLSGLPFNTALDVLGALPSYRSTRNRVTIGSASVTADVWMVSQADANAQYASVGSTPSAATGVLFVELADAAGQPLEGIPLAGIALTDAGAPVTALGPYLFGPGGFLDPTLTTTVAFNGHARVAFLDVPPGTFTLAVNTMTGMLSTGAVIDAGGATLVRP